jgi:Family of unknown function (DUF6104)
VYFTDRGIEELDDRRGDEQVSIGWLAERLRDYVDEHPEAEAAIDSLATWLARLDDGDDEDDPGESRLYGSDGGSADGSYSGGSSGSGSGSGSGAGAGAGGDAETDADDEADKDDEADDLDAGDLDAGDLDADDLGADDLDDDLDDHLDDEEPG